MDVHGKVSGGGFGKRGVRIQVDGNLQASETGRPQISLGIGLQDDAARLHPGAEPFHPQRHRIGREPSGDEEGVDGNGFLFQHQPAHGKQAHEGVFRIGEDNEGAVRQRYFVKADGGNGLLESIFGLLFPAERKNVPVGRCRVIVMCENARPGQFHVPDVILSFQEGDIVQGEVQAPEGGKGVGEVFLRSRTLIPCLQQIEPSLRTCVQRVVTCVSAVRVSNRKVIGLQMQEGEALDYMGLDFPERYISFHQVGRNPVHHAGENFGPEGNLKADKKQQDQPGQPQHNIPYDFPRLHLSTKLANLPKLDNTVECSCTRSLPKD